MTPDGESAGLESIDHLDAIYEMRHTEKLNRDRAVVWDCVVNRVIQPLVPQNATFLDLGAGDCLVINRVSAREKIAVDLGSRTLASAKSDVRVLQTSSTDLSALGAQSIDVVFSSNFFEHLPTKQDLLTTLKEVERVLRPGGLLLVIMPNLRYVRANYWDYLDHQIPLTDRSLAEATVLSGLHVRKVVPRFLPYTINNSRLPRGRTLVNLYLSFPLAWRLWGKQLFLIAEKRI